MQRLQMSSERRGRLLADGLLAINARGQEVLHGLTHEETQFLIDSDGETMSDAMLERRGALMLRHEQARLRMATADDEASRGEAHRMRVTTRF